MQKLCRERLFHLLENLKILIIFFRSINLERKTKQNVMSKPTHFCWNFHFFTSQRVLRLTSLMHVWPQEGWLYLQGPGWAWSRSPWHEQCSAVPGVVAWACWPVGHELFYCPIPAGKLGSAATRLCSTQLSTEHVWTEACESSCWHELELMNSK